LRGGFSSEGSFRRKEFLRRLGFREIFGRIYGKKGGKLVKRVCP